MAILLRFDRAGTAPLTRNDTGIVLKCTNNGTSVELNADGSTVLDAWTDLFPSIYLCSNIASEYSNGIDPPRISLVFCNLCVFNMLSTQIKLDGGGAASVRSIIIVK